VLSPYLWFAGIKGDVATVPTVPPAPIEVILSQALEDTQAALMLLFTAKKSRHGVFFYFLYTDVESDEELIPPPNWDLDTTLKLGGGLGVVIPPGTELNHTESWTAPVIGITRTTPFGDSKFYFSGGAGIGGFGVGSDLFFDINANIGYQWKKAIGTVIGYQLFDVDYEKDNFLYEVAHQG
jgi:hypothetical protein